MNFEVPQMNKDPKSVDAFVQKSLEYLRRHDRKTFEHSLEVGRMTSFLIRNMERVFSEKEKTVLLQAAFLHDYGKIGVEERILNKEGKLSPEEIEKIKLHPRIGFNRLKDWNMDVAKVVASHHDYQEHSYPREHILDDVWEKRSGDNQTKKLSRVLAMIDAFQAMLADRPGKDNKPKSIDQAIVELRKRFILPKDQEAIILLETYYRQKNPDEKADYSKYINLAGNA